MARGTHARFSRAQITRSTYRPFHSSYAYFDRLLNHERGQTPSMFPTPHHTNIGIVLTGAASNFRFTPFITDRLPDLHILDTAQSFPRWTYEKVDPADGGFNFSAETDVDKYGYQRVDNVTDEILAIYRDAVGPQVSKDEIFYFVYGQLHDPHYRVTYAADLKKMLPHIPTPATRKRFESVSGVGRRLAELHTNFEKVEPYPLSVELKKGASAEDLETWRVSKMKWARVRDEETGKLVNDPTTIIYNPKVTISGIPYEADDYLLGSRSALGWVIERWQVSTDKTSGLVNDPNDWCDEVGDPRYIVDLIARVITVAMETNRLVDSLGALDAE